MLFDDKYDAPGQYRSAKAVARRFALWWVVCAVSAVPSFFWASGQFNRPAMFVGVLLFAIGYTVVTSTDAFMRFKSRPFMRRTLYIGYFTRLGASVLFPIGAAVDLLPGIISVELVGGVGLDPHTFAGTLATTFVQGGFLNVLIAMFMGVVYAIQRATMKPPHVAGRAFEVVIPPPQ